ncbi:GNAT family N-acetyltransferase [Acinetobacter sp. VNH17]|uniref:GNAT family N-acetyltransferase n=1 Tax=Acinetobacter thutiue TaxID=2998078 RepID=A0ABT7WK08_9GAMM|nr:GNAT family N-acetyltransferase [Acinetobacter thutiue]MCY6410917.1 GNAT family N-acetyltransferase [Acinetobacter thutiue]MDN0013019.1 GNAT family N-acetyltransferase [Acinetobacter thutiue]
MSLNIRKVENDDLEQLVELINAAYRRQSGRSWTTEQAFVAGDRINKTQLINQLGQINFELFIGEAQSKQLVACIGLSYQQDSVEIGTFAIDPSIQNSGFGKEILAYAEQFVMQNHPSITHFLMYVLDVRTELMAYYQRRGYQLTGKTEAYPVAANVGQPLVPIQLVEMRKDILRQQ